MKKKKSPETPVIFNNHFMHISKDEIAALDEKAKNVMHEAYQILQDSQWTHNDVPDKNDVFAGSESNDEEEGGESNAD